MSHPVRTGPSPSRSALQMEPTISFELASTRQHHLDHVHGFRRVNKLGRAQVTPLNPTRSSIWLIRGPPCTRTTRDPDIIAAAITARSFLQSFIDHGATTVLDDERRAGSAGCRKRPRDGSGSLAGGFLHAAVGCQKRPDKELIPGQPPRTTLQPLGDWFRGATMDILIVTAELAPVLLDRYGGSGSAVTMVGKATR